MPKGSWGLAAQDDGAENDEPARYVSEPKGRPAAAVAETERERQFHGLAVLSLFLHSTATVEEMLNALLEQAPTVTGAVFVYPLILDSRRQVLRASMLEGCTDASLDRAMDAFQEDLTALEFSPVQNEALGRILEEGEVVVQEGFSVLMEGVLPREQWQAGQKALHVSKLALAPMVVEGEPLGMVLFAFEDDAVDVEALELLVGHLTLALRDTMVRDEVTRFSDIDPVTWVHTRRFLLHALESEIGRAGRYARGLSLVLLDIDDFGAFNETYGQSIGDRLLRTVATTLAETVAPPELVARVKDDDFAVLLPETNRAAAVTTTTRLLAALSQVSAFSGESEEAQPVTVSVAIVCFPEDAMTPQALLARAQADLDIAKNERAKEMRKRGASANGPPSGSSGNDRGEQATSMAG